jgi:hypothetical protein
MVISIQINRFKRRQANSNLDLLLWNKGEQEEADREVMAVVVAVVELRDEEEEVEVVKWNDGY